LNSSPGIHHYSPGPKRPFPWLALFGGFSLLINRPSIAQAFRAVCQQRSIKANIGQYVHLIEK
ncbi:hypothetical protein LZ357_26785, partial [Serratia marcescens]